MSKAAKGTLYIYGGSILIGIIIFMFFSGCQPAQSQGKKEKDVVATLQLSPTPIPKIGHIVPRPEVKHVAVKAQPTPEPAAQVKAIVQRLPSIQRTRWSQIKIKPQFEIAANKAVMLYERNTSRYETVEKMRSNGVSAPVLFALHYRESDNDFTCHPHEGSSLAHRTRYVPKGRLPPPKEPPYKWEVSAEDAYYVADRLQGDWSDMVWAFNSIERFNGMGYKKRGIPSPYVWSGTQYYTSGKFVSDGHFSASAVDKQLGCLAILKRMQERGIAISFDN